PRDALERPDEEPSVIARAPLDEALVIDPPEEPWPRAAGERLEGVVALFTRRRTPRADRGVDRRPVEPRRRGDVLGALGAPFGREGGDPEPDEIIDDGGRLQIFGREEVGAIVRPSELAVDDELVRQPARLRARAAVRAPTPDRFAGEALARVRDAERAV